MDDFYSKQEFESKSIEPTITGKITEKHRFKAAKQVLLGLAIIYTITILAYLIRPEQGKIFVEICNNTFPELATLILAFYFRDKTGQ